MCWIPATLLIFCHSATVGSPVSISIDRSSPGQTIEGFGASSAWYDRFLPDFSPEAREGMVDFLFDPQHGLGLSIHRIRIDPVPAGQPGGPVYDWSHPRIQAQGEALRLVKNRHHPRFIAAPWTPPAWMKSNAELKNGGRLLEQHYPAYAAYLVEWLRGMKEHFGIEVEILSIQNEPDDKKQWESCIWTAEEMAAFISGHLKPALDQASLPTKLMAYEHTVWDDGPLNTILKDPVAGPALSYAAAHLYHGSRSRPKVFAQAVARGMPVWMTEFYLGDYAMEKPFVEHDRVLQLGRVMHDTLVRSQVNAYLFWWMWAPPDKPSEGLIIAEFGDTFTPPFTTWRPTEKAYGMAHFSRFIRPGATRFNVVPEQVKEGVRLSAFVNPDNCLVLVAINESSQPAEISWDDPSLAGCRVRTIHVTTAEDSLKPLSADSIGSGITLPARSLVTILFEQPESGTK